MPLIVDSGSRGERTAWIACALLALLSACGAPFSASGERLAAAGDAGETPDTVPSAEAGSAPAAGGAAPAPQGGAGTGGEKTTTSAGAASGGAPNAGAGGSTVPAAGAGGSGAACLDGWKGSSCDKCAGITDQYDHAMCESVVDCCKAQHLDCTSSCNQCGCGHSYNETASEVFACLCGGAR